MPWSTASSSDGIGTSHDDDEVTDHVLLYRPGWVAIDPDDDGSLRSLLDAYYASRAGSTLGSLREALIDYRDAQTPVPLAEPSDLAARVRDSEHGYIWAPLLNGWTDGSEFVFWRELTVKYGPLTLVDPS